MGDLVRRVRPLTPPDLDGEAAAPAPVLSWRCTLRVLVRLADAGLLPLLVLVLPPYMAATDASVCTLYSMDRMRVRAFLDLDGLAPPDSDRMVGTRSRAHVSATVQLQLQHTPAARCAAPVSESPPAAEPPRAVRVCPGTRARCVCCCALPAGRHGVRADMPGMVCVWVGQPRSGQQTGRVNKDAQKSCPTPGRVALMTAQPERVCRVVGAGAASRRVSQDAWVRMRCGCEAAQARWCLVSSL